MVVKSAIKKSRRKSQQEAARLQKQADAVLAMEEDEEIHFKRPKIVPEYRGIIAQIQRMGKTGK